MGDKNWTFNVSDGGQVNVANNNATIYVTQNNGVNTRELNNIIKGIVDNLADLKEEDAENIKDVVEIAKEELLKTEPNVSKLSNCLTLVAPMFTIANGIPTLASNLHNLADYIISFIRQR